MEKSDTAYFSLLRSALWNEGFSFDGSVDLNEVLRTAYRQTTVGLVCQAVLRSRIGAVMSEKGRIILRRQIFAIANTHSRINAVIAKVVTALRKKGIESVLMKGQGLAADYPVAVLRQCGDIDLYVGEQNFDAACAVVNDLAGQEEVAKNYIDDIHYQLKVDEVVVEIHRVTCRFPDEEEDVVFQSYSEKGMKAGGNFMMTNGVRVWLPNDTFNAFFVFYHAWGHLLSGGIGMRQLCDWAVLLHAKRATIDREELSEMLHRLHLMKEWRVFGRIAVEYLGLPREEMPFYEKKHDGKVRQCLGIILKIGNFGDNAVVNRHYRRTGIKSRLITFYTLMKMRWRVFRVSPRLFFSKYRVRIKRKTKKLTSFFAICRHDNSHKE